MAQNGQSGPGMPDPINALQNLASQGTRNNPQIMGGMGGPQQNQMGGPQQMPPITASNLLQTLNRPGQNMNNIPGVRPTMGMVPNGGQMANQLQGQVVSNIIFTCVDIHVHCLYSCRAKYLDNYKDR